MVPRNFRDVGEWANCLAGRQLVREGVLLRSGKLDAGTRRADIGGARTVVHLRMHPDAPVDGARMVQVATSNDLEKYDTANREVRAWLVRALAVIIEANTDVPVLYHCASGKDRTGILVAVALVAVGLPRSIAVDEYALSDGASDRTLIESALAGVGDARAYLAGLDCDALAGILRTEL